MPTGALLEALINYFPESRRRLLRKAAEKQKLIETRGLSAIEKRLDDPTLVDKLVEDLERKLAVPTLSDSSSDCRHRRSRSRSLNTSPTRADG